VDIEIKAFGKEHTK
jgi:large subunit ribosomal protein L3